MCCTRLSRCVLLVCHVWYRVPCVVMMCHVCVMCVSRVCHVCVMCVSCVCHVCVMCVSCVCVMCVSCVCACAQLKLQSSSPLFCLPIPPHAQVLPYALQGGVGLIAGVIADTWIASGSISVRRCRQIMQGCVQENIYTCINTYICIYINILTYICI